jgi:hypothetical protein
VGQNTRYGLRIRNLAHPDNGGWRLRDSNFSGYYRGTVPYACTAGLRWESAGAGTIDGCIFWAAGSPGLVTGMDFAGTNSTVDIFINNISIENYTGNAIRIVGVNRMMVNNVEMEGKFQGSNAAISIGNATHPSSILTFNNIIAVGDASQPVIDGTHTTGNINIGSIITDALGTSSGQSQAVVNVETAYVQTTGIEAPFYNVFGRLPFFGVQPGTRAFCTDATVTTFGSRLTVGGGTNTVPIWFKAGVGWIIG